MDHRRSGQDSEERKVLSPQQRANIEELVQLSPQVIKGRVRRDGISASVLDAYTRPTGPQAQGGESAGKDKTHQ